MLDTSQSPAAAVGRCNKNIWHRDKSISHGAAFIGRAPPLPSSASLLTRPGSIYTGHVLVHISLSPYAPWQANRARRTWWSAERARVCAKRKRRRGGNERRRGCFLPVFVWPDLDRCEMGCCWLAEREENTLSVVNFIWPDTRRQKEYNLTHKAVFLDEWYVNWEVDRKQFLPNNYFTSILNRNLMMYFFMIHLSNAIMLHDM